MRINWKLRFKNKATLVALIVCGLDLIYSTFSILGIVPSISKGDLMDFFTAGFDLLAIMGIIVDPTTEGIGDSDKALSYDNPKVDVPDEDHTDTEYKG